MLISNYRDKFQSTLPQRERPLSLYVPSHTLVISIHTPTKGATITLLFIFLALQVFQSTLPQRERPGTFYINIYAFLFQSTLPQRERRSRCRRSKRSFKFQSTLPQRERRLDTSTHKATGFISIHTPTKGATEQKQLLSLCKIYFNPHSHKGSDGCKRLAERFDNNFNPHSHKGSDRRRCSRKNRSYGISIHTPTKGAT